MECREINSHCPRWKPPPHVWPARLEATCRLRMNHVVIIVKIYFLLYRGNLHLVFCHGRTVHGSQYWLVAGFYLAAVASDVLLQNPSPVPIGEKAMFTCSAISLGIIWITNAVNNTIGPHDPTSTMPVPRTAAITVPAIPLNNNTNITCLTIEQQQNTTQLYIYG